MGKFSIGHSMARRMDRLDFWSFSVKTPILTEPCPLSESRTNSVICYLERGDVLNIDNYIENDYGIWGWYSYTIQNRLHKHYVRLYDRNDGYQAIHKIINLDD